MKFFIFFNNLLLRSFHTIQTQISQMSRKNECRDFNLLQHDKRGLHQVGF